MAEDAGRLNSLCFASDGAELHRSLAADQLAELTRLFDDIGSDAGVRLSNAQALELIAGKDSLLIRQVSKLLGAPAHVVRAIAFDKSPGTNWALGWHQDRTICVKRPAQIDGFGPWTIKQGLHHVQPPFKVTESMVTVRVHLDAVTMENAPLKIAVQTHRLGQIADADAERVAKEHELLHCEANAGDVWFYSTPILHASDRSISKGRRRVLQLDFSAKRLPPPLEWLLA
ncbi:phytanoyl-CoA dioxygenase family protein [Erythrobacter sp. SD-21]|uniref:phytanoyl-CoA dioxygenase family protein n=1 Tax=Erythrobacter sp. SD-21 TaxID=161528 RepID=UPI000153F2D9|nr:phytanoyl-CoA dioxygenase family protein [Erythrobacter sp. SD-21]EDL47818.1 hypothetical protein ED21_25091 [Erythrobacter sp. SD-21]